MCMSRMRRSGYSDVGEDYGRVRVGRQCRSSIVLTVSVLRCRISLILLYRLSNVAVVCLVTSSSEACHGLESQMLTFSRLINYTPQATIVRLLTINAVNAYVTSTVLSLLGGFRDARLLLPGWIGIATVCPSPPLSLSFSSLSSGLELTRHAFAARRLRSATTSPTSKSLSARRPPPRSTSSPSPPSSPCSPSSPSSTPAIRTTRTFPKFPSSPPPAPWCARRARRREGPWGGPWAARTSSRRLSALGFWDAPAVTGRVDRAVSQVRVRWIPQGLFPPLPWVWVFVLPGPAVLSL